MAEKIQLEVVTPERRVLSEMVDGVQVPGLNGELGILPGHVPLISQLQTGVLSYTQGGQVQRLHVSGGFVEVNADRVSVLAEVAEHPGRDRRGARASRTRTCGKDLERVERHRRGFRDRACAARTLYGAPSACHRSNDYGSLILSSNTNANRKAAHKL